MRKPRPSPRHRLSRTLAVALLSLTVGGDALADRPRIGLALGGGGARGAAHIGVLKVIERLRIPVDYVAGTSMGAIIGALYAMRKSPERIEDIVEEIDWDTIFRDAPRRKERRMRRKLDDRTFLIEQRPGVDEQNREINLLPALIQGQRLDLALRRYTLPSRNITDFDDLPIPFRAVAADIETGDVVVLGEGDLAQAVRASMAVPAVFAPVEVDGRLLVDGGLAMNLPVEVVRDMGADIVIAVDVSGPRRTREEITHVMEMLEQVAALVTWRNSHAQMKQLRDRDVLITPALGREVLASDFNKMPLAVTIGERGAETRSGALGRHSLSSDAYLAYRDGRTVLPRDLPVIDYVRIENNSRISDEVLLARLDVRPGEPVDLDRVERQIEQIHDQDNFESVRYYIESKDGKTGLIVRANEKSWGTSSIQGGMELSSSSGGNSLFNIGAAYTQMPINRLNAEWRTVLQLGEEPVLFTEFYQPLDPREDWFVELGAGLVSKTVNLFTEESDERPEAKHDLSQIGARLAAGRNFGNWGRASLAYSRFNGDADVRIGGPDISGYKYRVGEIEARVLVDTMDNSAFPQNGWLGTAFARTSEESLGATSSYKQAGGAIARNHQWGRNSLSGAFMFKGTFDGDAPTEGLYRLGGFLNLSGFDQRELSGQYAGLAMGVYTRDLGTEVVSTYLGASLELGNVWRDSDDIDFGSLLGAGSLFLGAKTFLGPLYLGYGYAQGGRDALYFILGRPWTGAAFTD